MMTIPRHYFHLCARKLSGNLSNLFTFSGMLVTSEVEARQQMKGDLHVAFNGVMNINPRSLLEKIVTRSLEGGGGG